MTQFARERLAFVLGGSGFATATPAPARLSLSPVGPGRRASHWERARAGCLTFASAALTPRTRLLGLARRAPQPGNHRQGRRPLRKLADRSLRPSVRSPDRARAAQASPGRLCARRFAPRRSAAAEAVGQLASLPEASRRQPRLAAGCLTGTLTAGQCFTLARLRNPAKWLVPHQLAGTLRPAPVRQTQRVLSLRLPCAALRTAPRARTLKLTRPLRPAPFRSRRYAPRPAETGTEGRASQLAEKFADNPGLLHWPGCQDNAPCFALRTRLGACGDSSLALLARLEPSLHSGSC